MSGRRAVQNPNHNVAMLGAVSQRQVPKCVSPGSSKKRADLNSFVFTCIILSTIQLLLLYLRRIFSLYDVQQVRITRLIYEFNLRAHYCELCNVYGHYFHSS